MHPTGKIIRKINGTKAFLFALFCIFTVALTAPALAQQTLAAPADSLKLSLPDSTQGKKTDSLTSIDSLGISLSPDALDDEVKASASDSAVYDLSKNVFYLYGNTSVVYGALQLEAGRIIYEQESGNITAMPLYDSNGVAMQKPSFKQGQEQFSYDSLRYNFKSKRAVVRNARSQYGEGFVFSQQVKRNPDESIYGWKNVYTTCSLDTPHFGIRAKKIRVIPSRVIASGAANLMIEDVPTPLYLPFGIFPISQRQRSGFVLPTYTVENLRGLGLLGGGYYFNLGHFADLLLTTNIYSKGSWGLVGITNYAQRYRYNGNLRLSYAYNKQGEVYEQNGGVIKEFFINWSHQKDQRSRPGVNFNANVNLGSTNYFANNSYNVNQIINNQYSSNITFQKNWLNKPYSLTVSATHNQNTATREVRVNLPDVQFFINPQTPLARKNPVGKARWYEKITVGYSLNLKNGMVFYDTSFSLNKISLNDFSNGMIQNVPINAAYNVLKFLNLTLAANYNEYWLTQRLYTNYNPIDKRIDSAQSRGFYTSRDFNFSAGLNTRIFGIKKFSKGSIRGIRHEIKPNVSFNYRPDFGVAPFNYGYNALVDSFGRYEYLSPYVYSPVAYPALGRQGAIGLGIGNNLQMKVRSAKDTASGTKNIRLLDRFDIATSYNIAADSFKWAPLTLSFGTNLLERISLSGGARWDFYDFDQSTGRRLPTTLLHNKNGFAHFSSAGVSVQASFNSKKDAKNKPISNDDESLRLLRYAAYDYVDFNIPWNFNIAYSLDLQKVYRGAARDTFRVNQTLTLNGDFNLTSRWKIAVSTGYNFLQKELTLTSIDLYRDLHCWEMRLGAIPFGRNRSFNFTLNVKATVLQDLKLVRRRNFRDAVF